jgi:hypothetical protein
MKSKYFVVGFLLLILFSFSTMVRGADWEVEEDELYIYEIKSFDEDLAEDVFVNDDIEDILGEDAEVDAMTAQMITDVDEIDDFNNDATEDDPGWAIEGWIWIADWTNDEEDFEDAEVPDISEYSNFRIPEDPEEYGAMIPGWELLLVLLLTYTGAPSPADDWLEDIDWADVDADGSELTYEYDSSGDPTLNEDYEMVWKWDEDGVYLGKEAIVDGDTIYEVVGITAIASVGLIYIIMRKK